MRTNTDTTHYGNGKKATRHNLKADRRSANGPATSKVCNKKKGNGACNWGAPGDEMNPVDLDRADPAYDSCDELMEKAFGTSPSDRRHFDWTFVQDCDDADAKMMDEIEAQMCSDWMKDMDRDELAVTL